MPKRSKEYQDINVQVQGQYEYDEKICQCIQNCKPPPPPGREDLWELQFCRWWGWNWVRKRQNYVETKIEVETKKGAPKTNFRELCDCLRFKKGETEVETLQILYNTPSNSVVVQQKNSREVNEPKFFASIRNLEVQRNISQKKVRDHEGRSKNVESWVKARDDQTSNVSSEECFSITEGFRSTTDESIEYIKINCCPCCHDGHHGHDEHDEHVRHHGHHVHHVTTDTKQQASPVEEKPKFTRETQTSKQATNVNVTQTDKSKSNDNMYATESIKKHKKKRVCLICCHCMHHHCRKCKGKHQSSGKQEKFTMRENTTQYECKRQYTLPVNPRKNVMEGYEGYLNIAGRYPLERLLYCDISNFATSPQKYLKLYNTRSDIMDKLQRLKIDETFASPISGEIYNLTPINVDNFEVKPTILPEPIDVTADIKHLEKIENGFQTDRESRVMLDAVCDAILSNNRCRTNSSTILNEITYSLKEPEPHTINHMFNTEDNYKLPIFKKSVLDETNYFNILNDNSSSKYGNDTILNSFSYNEKQKETNNTNIDNMIQSLMLNYETTPEQTTLQKLVHNNEPNWTHEIMQDATRPRLYNEYTSSLLSNQEYMNEKPKEIKNIDMLNTNVNDIFKKIEEIIVKSKINDTEIQNVLNTIPKRTCHLSSEKITSENDLDGYSFTNPLPDNSSFLKNMLSDTLQQNDSSQIEDFKDTHKQKKSFCMKPCEAENEKKMLPAKKRKKNSISYFPHVKKTDKLKSNRRK